MDAEALIARAAAGRAAAVLAACWAGWCVAAGSAVAASAEPDRVGVYRGLCDASAAVALDAQRFIVADDESNRLVVYRIGHERPESELDLDASFGASRRKGNGKGKAKEADLEGAARIGDRIYWIASHGRDSGGDLEPGRLRFFSTAVTAGHDGEPRVERPTRPPFTQLLQHLLADPRFAVLARADAAALPPKEPGGLNIEGLAATPEGGLLIGFRNPLPEGRAMLVPLINPAAVIEQGAKPVFGDAVLLDLGRRGVRSIELVRGRYVIAAGPIGEAGGSAPGGDFALFGWSGRPDEAALRLDGITLGDLKPEALFERPGTSALTLLSDDGSACKKKALKRGQQRFRALEFELR